jgi:hypothetical protein
MADVEIGGAALRIGTQLATHSVAVGAGVVLNWVFATRRLLAETKKLRTENGKLAAETLKFEFETIKLAGDNLKEVQRTRAAYDTACQSCKFASQKLQGLITGRSLMLEIIAAREEFCTVFAKSTLSAYADYTEWMCLSYKGRPDRIQDFIINDTKLELERLSSWQRVINLPLFLETYSAAPLRLEKRTLRPFYQIAQFIERDGDSFVTLHLGPALSLLEG